MEDGAKVTSDVFNVTCTAADGQNYRSIHLAIAVNQTVSHNVSRRDGLEYIIIIIHKTLHNFAFLLY